jgi:hypothetical protein
MDLRGLMTERLHDSLVEKSRWQVVALSEVKGTMQRLGEEELNRDNWHARIGKMVFADSVLFGEILSARERVGGEYGAESPASIHLVLSLLDVARRKVIWRAEFQETQKSLTENLFFVFDFFTKGAKWLTVKELMDRGIEKATKNLIAEAAGRQR